VKFVLLIALVSMLPFIICLSSLCVSWLFIHACPSVLSNVYSITTSTFNLVQWFKRWLLKCLSCVKCVRLLTEVKHPSTSRHTFLCGVTQAS
jgi:hypothetical protein